MDGPPILEIERPRSAFDLLGATIDLYRRYPGLFPALAFGVVVPYEVIVLLATGRGPLGGQTSFGTGLLLLAIESFLITPLVSALHVHAVDDVREGHDPTIGSVARRGLLTVPVVVAAAIISSLGIALGFLALVVPGIFLTLRWAVVAQAAALEGESWVDALRRSRELTDKNYLHILGLVLLIGLIGGGVTYAVGIPFSNSHVTALSFIVGVTVVIFVRSFSALATALLYFDLKARLRLAPAAGSAREESEAFSRRAVPPTGHPLDPASWSDDDRPRGWYVDPEKPEQMRYWLADGAGVWSRRRAKTPKATLAEWKERSA